MGSRQEAGAIAGFVPAGADTPGPANRGGGHRTHGPPYSCPNKERCRSARWTGGKRWAAGNCLDLTNLEHQGGPTARMGYLPASRTQLYGAHTTLATAAAATGRGCHKREATPKRRGANQRGGVFIPLLRSSVRWSPASMAIVPRTQPGANRGLDSFKRRPRMPGLGRRCSMPGSRHAVRKLP